MVFNSGVFCWRKDGNKGTLLMGREPGGAFLHRSITSSLWTRQGGKERGGKYILTLPLQAILPLGGSNPAVLFCSFYDEPNSSYLYPGLLFLGCLKLCIGR